MEALDALNEKVRTISELRSFWLDHPYSQIFRVFSEHFLRKYYCRHIFNSRILNYGVHLKYRNKLLESIQNPSSFTSLKDF